MKSFSGLSPLVLAILIAAVKANTMRIGGGHKRTHKNVGIRYAKPHIETINDDQETNDHAHGEPEENGFPYFGMLKFNSE